jgi:hypothetical protein
MAKRRTSSEGEVSLFPFLSILACLIGALVLMIVVLVIAQMGKAEGRSPEEIKRAQDYLQMQKELEERAKLDVSLKEKIALLDEVKKQLDERQQRFIKLRRLRDTSKDIQESNMKLSLEMQKELDDLLVEIDGYKVEQTTLSTKIAELQAELKKRQVPPEKKTPPVIVQPSGSGMAEGTQIFFVEATGGALKILGAWGEDYRLSSATNVVIADVVFNHFLAEVAKVPNAMILFLVRDDGSGSFTNGAGRAEADYKLRFGKLPIPGRGTIDLAMFEKYRGKIPPPPKPEAETPKK